MIEIRHDLTYQTPRNSGSIIQMGSCRMLIVNSLLWQVPSSTSATRQSETPRNFQNNQSLRLLPSTIYHVAIYHSIVYWDPYSFCGLLGLLEVPGRMAKKSFHVGLGELGGWAERLGPLS